MAEHIKVIELRVKTKADQSPKNLQQDRTLSNSQINRLQPQERQRMKALEGQCKILETKYLQVNYFKGIIWGIVVTISVIGLLLIKHYQSLRAMLFYNRLEKEQKQKATHVYVKGIGQVQEICVINQKKIDQKVVNTFQFKNLQYQILENEEIPLALNYEKQLIFYISEGFGSKGLSSQQVNNRALFYGVNEHKVQVPNYFQYIFDVMTQPFFIFQDLVSVIYILEGAAVFGILMIAFGWVTTSINYILLRRSFLKIKETAQKEFPIRVLRNGEFLMIKNTELVPGDVYQPKQQIPCDSIIINGDLFVNEASLTGEDVPISKVKLTDVAKANQPCHWIFEGSVIQTVKQNTLAVAIDIGFGSRKGRIIRKILTNSPKQPQFFRKLIYFLVQVLIISIIVYFATLEYLLSTEIQTVMVVFRFLDVITSSFPAPFPIYFNLAYSFCLVRLQRDDVMGIEPQKTVQSGRLKTLCFDKTGTLTQNKMKLDKIFQIQDSSKIKNVTHDANEYPTFLGLFATCNSVEMINGEPKGDEIDLQMFLHSKAKISPNPSHQALQQVIRTVVAQRQSFDILRINQYESRFQSMSVLVHSQGRFYIFAKGSPEMIHNHSELKNHQFDGFIKELSLEGYRSIAFGCREVTKDEVGRVLKLERGQFLKSIRIIGIVSFVNLLKPDAQQTIEVLSRNEINTKIITGDNIYLGIQTAILTGMIPSNAQVAILQGAKCKADGAIEIKTLSRNSEGGFTEELQEVQGFQYRQEPSLFYAIDNDFIQKNEGFLNSRVKVFARISPENKALIVRKHKQLYTREISSKPFLERHFGQCGLKVGMVGDGANDLIAIKQADVGIGIAGADAVYSASFAIKTLSQIQIIIKEAKNTERQVIDIVQYFGIVQLMLTIQSIILIKDGSQLTSTQLIYCYFVSSIVITFLLAVSRPAQTLCKYFNTTNFMGLQHHLVYWGNMAIYTAGMILSYEYYQATSDFVPNPNPAVTFANGYNSVTKSTSVIFLCQNIINISLAVFVYRGYPWKQPFYKNKAFTILIIVNIILIVPIYFTTKSLSFLDLQPIGLTQAGIVLAIMASTAFFSFGYNQVIEKLAFHERNYGQENIQKQIKYQKNETMNVLRIKNVGM